MAAKGLPTSHSKKASFRAYHNHPKSAIEGLETFSTKHLRACMWRALNLQSSLDGVTGICANLSASQVSSRTSCVRGWHTEQSCLARNAWAWHQHVVFLHPHITKREHTPATGPAMKGASVLSKLLLSAEAGAW
eukprot:1158485-Pelagomonas_calceolata.AAC.10